MRYQELLELYDPESSFPIEWNDRFGPEEMSGRAYDRQGNYIDIKFIPIKNGIVEVEFSRNDSYDMTGGGDANRVLGTVLEAFREYLRGYQPKIFIFSAKGGSRSKVYQSLIKRFAASAGYKQFDTSRLSPATREKLGASGTDVMVLRKMVNAGLDETVAQGIDKMFGNMYDPLFANLQRVAILAMQGRQKEAESQLHRAIKDADPAAQQRVRDAVNKIQPVTINGKIADSSTLDKSEQHQEWIQKTFIPWVAKTIVHQGVNEAPLADYQPMGDFTKPGPFRGADKRLVPHPTNQLKTEKFFEKTPYDFRLFFSNIPGTGRYSEYGPMEPRVIQEIFGANAQQILAGHEDAITVVFVGNKGDSKVMLTPWMMAHRIGHAVQAGTRLAGGRGAWREAENHFFRGINQLLKDFYGKSSNNRYDSEANWALNKEYAALFNAIGTQRSSRTGQIKRPYEFLYELFAQYLGTGRIELNPLPKSKEYGHKAWGRSSQSLRMAPGAEEESKYTTEVLARDMEIMFGDVLSELVGKVLVM